MKSAGRAMYLQIAGLGVALICFLIVAHLFPLANWLADVQQRVMHWGAWSAICYPLLYALCNVLLLPGGILSMGGEIGRASCRERV